jgi:catabolite regulation protein CreA
VGSIIRKSQTPLADCSYVAQSYIKIEDIKDMDIEGVSHLVSKKWRKVAKNLRNIFPQSIRD